jgi:hypothetical protein
MTVTINGTTGIAGVDGSAGTPAIQGADTNTGMFFPAADTIAFAEGGVEVMRLDSSANLRFNSGYGSVATAYGCRAWITFNGQGTPAIVASGNVTSITDNAAGNYTLNFTTAMSDANYAMTFGVCGGGSGLNAAFVGNVLSATQYGAPTNKTTSACQVYFCDYTSTGRDFSQVYVSIFR